MVIARLSKGMIVAFCALSLLFSQQLCAAEFLLSATHPSHNDADGHSNHDHSQSHQHDKGPDDTCCKNQPTLGLSQITTLLTHKLVPSLTPIFPLELRALSLVDIRSAVVRTPERHHPPDLASRAPPLSISRSPNAPPSLLSI